MMGVMGTVCAWPVQSIPAYCDHHQRNNQHSWGRQVVRQTWLVEVATALPVARFHRQMQSTWVPRMLLLLMMSLPRVMRTFA